MSRPEVTYHCDECARVVAKVDEHGDIIVTVRHDKDYHTTRIPRGQLTGASPSAKD